MLASYDAGADLLTVWSATQTPHLCRGTLADLLERDLESIRVIAPFVGGGFGTKAPFYAEEAVIPAAAMKLGRPVKWQEDRREHFLVATQERDQHWKVAIAVDAQGKILGLRGTMLHDTGAFLPWGIIVPYIAATTFPGPYVVPAYRIEATVALTNRVPTTVVRGAGRPQAVFAMERLMDRVARELELDPRRGAPPQHDPRRSRCPIRSASCSATASRSSMPAAIFPRARRSALALCRLRGFRARQTKRARARPLSRHRHRQLRRRHRARPVRGRHRARAARTARSRSRPARRTQGQGTRTTLSQIVADEVGCRIEDIVMTVGDTAAIAQGVGAFASRQAVNAGSSALIAGADVRKQIVELAARALGVPESDIDVEDGRAIARSRQQAVACRSGELARIAQGMPGFSFAPGQTPGPRAHRLFHAAAGLLLQRHACRRSRGRSDDRRRDASSTTRSRTTAATSSIR